MQKEAWFWKIKKDLFITKLGEIRLGTRYKFFERSLVNALLRIRKKKWAAQVKLDGRTMARP